MNAQKIQINVRTNIWDFFLACSGSENGPTHLKPNQKTVHFLKLDQKTVFPLLRRIPPSPTLMYQLLGDSACYRSAQK